MYVCMYTQWNITVGHESMTDQLVFMTDHNFALIGHTYIIDQSVSYCTDGRESMSNTKV